MDAIGSDERARNGGRMGNAYRLLGAVGVVWVCFYWVDELAILGLLSKIDGTGNLTVWFSVIAVACSAMAALKASRYFWISTGAATVTLVHAFLVSITPV